MRDTQVLVIGGSLNGLTCALLLARQGVRCIVVERRSATTVQYKFRGISPRSMEIFRAAGIEASIREHRSGDQKAGEIARAPNLASEDVHFHGKPWADALDLSAVTAETCDQDRLEPILRDAAQQLGADVRFGVEVVGIEQGRDEVLAAVRRPGQSATESIRASYAITCDGAAGTTRESVGIGRHGPGVLQHWMNLIFAADLKPDLRGRRFTSCFITDINGTLVPREDRWLLALQYSPERGEKPEDFDEARTQDLVRAAAGNPSLLVKVFDARSWQVSAYVADRFREGRVFIVGDAAHTMPPTGAFGGNTGIHDAHNLAWKLALVLRQRASAGLLDSYDAERRPIAEATVGQALARLAAWFKNLGDRLPSTPPVVDDSAVIFGQCYDTGGFEDPRAPSGRPGTRAPHVAVTIGTKRVPVHDLLETRFLLLTAPDDDLWSHVAPDVARHFGVEFAVGRLPRSDADNAQFARAYGIGERGAALIRPDGFIAWRTAVDSNPADALRAALSAQLGAP